ncbi:MAG: TRAP transporter substrate-binding protein DctP [Rhodospirillaceae bacterium]
MIASRTLLALSGAALLALSPAAGSAQTVLKAATGLPSNLELAQSFLTHFRSAVNDSHKDVISINYMGGPEVVPPDKAGDALRRGQFDILHSPTAYYIGMVPEGYALTLATKMPAEVRANGGWAMLEKVWEEKANAKLLAWGEPGTQYNTYLAKKPAYTPDGHLSLDGFKMRVTGTYRPLFTALGATGVGIKASEVYTALQRGVVQGFGWPDVGIVALGLAKEVKYRIDPPFYRSNNTVAINLDAWNKLSADQQKILMDVSLDYEKEAVAFMDGFKNKDQQALLAGGMEVIDLDGVAKKHYIDSANVAVWDRLKEQSKIANELQQKFFPDWTPPNS